MSNVVQFLDFLGAVCRVLRRAPSETRSFTESFDSKSNRRRAFSICGSLRQTAEVTHAQMNSFVI